MSFRISSLPIEPFVPLFGLSDEALLKHGARRAIAGKYWPGGRRFPLDSPGFPVDGVSRRPYDDLDGGTSGT